MKIKTEDYSIWYDPLTETIHCQGSLRLNGMEQYTPIVELLNRVADTEPPIINLDVQNLEFLNSSGINILSKFVIRIRQKKTIQLFIKGSKSILWQGKSLKNLQRLMPSLILELE